MDIFLGNATEQNSHSVKLELVIALYVLMKQNSSLKTLLQRKFQTQMVSPLNFIKYLRRKTSLTQTQPGRGIHPYLLYEARKSIISQPHKDKKRNL